MDERGPLSEVDMRLDQGEGTSLHNYGRWRCAPRDSNPEPAGYRLHRRKRWSGHRTGGLTTKLTAKAAGGPGWPVTQRVGGWEG